VTYDWTSTGTSTPAGGPAIKPGRVAAETPAEPATPDNVSVAAIVEEFVAAAELGEARNRSGRRYRPNALRDLRGILRHHVVEALGDMPLHDVQPEDLQDLVDELAAEGLSVSRVRSVVSAIRALYGYAIEQGIVETSAADALEVPREEFRTPPTERIGAWDRDGGPSMREQAANWRDAAGAAWSESSFVRERREQRSADGDGDGDVVSRGTVLGLRPERILSIALRAILVIFLLLALLSLAESLLVPA
jgi:hypothetical protein